MEGGTVELSKHDQQFHTKGCFLMGLIKMKGDYLSYLQLKMKHDFDDVVENNPTDPQITEGVRVE